MVEAEKMVMGIRWALEQDSPGFDSTPPLTQLCGTTQQLPSLEFYIYKVCTVD